jgi:hypothetical protein
MPFGRHANQALSLEPIQWQLVCVSRVRRLEASNRLAPMQDQNRLTGSDFAQQGAK